ncbi:hypothetical protein GGR54DRAFT_647215 [Hypoxylon sp. NC1633]|nr:hypothetical protein GGR54DRAFT_647215 [Hypoxylon sp. NC1633]
MATTTAKHNAVRFAFAVERALPTTRRRVPVPVRIIRPGPQLHTCRKFISHQSSRTPRDRKQSTVTPEHRSNTTTIKNTTTAAPRETMAQAPDAPQHLVVVALETYFVPVPALDLPAPYTYDLREHRRTRADEVAERIKDADIIIVTMVPVGADVLRREATPRLKMVAVVASGTDSVDLAACRARGIVVANTPHCNAVSVAQHATALYFAARRSVALSHSLVQAGAWPQRGILQAALDDPDGKPPRTCRDEVLGIVGYGAVGRALEATAKALGMRVLVSDRKGAVEPPPEGRTPFDALIRESSVVALCLPRSRDTLRLISDPELAAMRRCAVLVNVSRGGIVDERALVAALRRRQIAGYATDVYELEPAGPENSALVGPDTAGLNLVTTPHVAWCAEDTNANYNTALKENISGWLSTGRPKYPVV